jgi:hypothetical protein
MPVYEAFSYLCKRPYASGVRGLGPAGGECLVCDQVPHEQVFFTKQSKKKKKVWEDGVLVVKEGGSELQREDGATVTKSNKIKGPPDIGSLIFLGSFEVCVRERERERERARARERVSISSLIFLGSFEVKDAQTNSGCPSIAVTFCS